MSESADRPTLAHQLKLDAICIHFEQDLRHGREPSVEEILECQPESERYQLLPQLLLIEFEYLDQAGSPPHLDDYLRRFPSQQTAVRRSFEEHLEASQRTSVKSHRDEPQDVDLLVGKRLGPYEVQSRIGQGGMGSVYLGVRVADYQQRVAIKLIRRGMDTEQILRRFRREMQFSATLSNHPNIAGLLDAGTTDDGLPYFVMEYVDGDRIDRYCDERRLGVSERLLLMCQVCSAVQHAHQRTVIHRDLKPSNIMVTEHGVPKLIDFGIAKLTEPEDGRVSIAATGTGQRVLTPEYASPEQIRGDTITTATDIYSLGVILYELLSGRKPYRLTSSHLSEVERVIIEEEPKKPSAAVGVRDTVDESLDDTDQTSPDQISGLRGVPAKRLKRMLNGDLDNIVLMALRKEPERRYASVEQLSTDIDNHLHGRSVSAQPDTWRYRTRKLVRRHRGVFIAAAVVLCTLSAGIAVSLSQMFRAERHAARADAINEFLVEDFIRAPDPHFYGDQGMTMYEAVRRAAARLKDSFQNQPETRASMHIIFAESLMNLGRYQETIEQCDLALEFFEQFPDDRRYAVETVKAVGMKGDALDNLSKFSEAETLLSQAYEQAVRRLGVEHPVTLSVMGQLGETLQSRNKYEEAEPLLRRANDLSLRLLEESDPNRYTPLNSLAAMLLAQERHDEAEPLRKQHLELTTRHLGPEHPDSINAMNQVASLYFYRAAVAARNGDEDERVGKLSLAEPIFKQLVEVATQVLPKNHPSLAVYEGNYGVTLAKLGRHAEGEPHVVNAYQVAQAAVGDDSDDTEWYLRNAVMFYDVWKEKEESPERRRELMARFEHHSRLFVQLRLLRADEDSVDRDTPQWWLDDMVSKLEDADADYIERYLDTLVKEVPSGAGRANYLGNLGILLASKERFSDAEDALRESYETRRASLGVEDEDTQWMQRELMQLYDQTGRPEEAEKLASE